jgi:hypothetical protein
VPVAPAWLIEFFEIESDPNNPLDLSNPDRDLVLGVSDAAMFDAGYYLVEGHYSRLSRAGRRFHRMRWSGDGLDLERGMS